MARPLRLQSPGACYHVINRGNFRFPVFEEDRDRELILEKLVDFAERFGVHVRAYCVQINHFHCYVQTAEANLGRFMQSFLTSFSVSYNRRHGTSGHVFQGRYKAFLVEEESHYRDQVSRYIHLNPACVPSLRDAELPVRQRAIRDCRWSSYAAVIGLGRCPRWLDRRAVLAGFPGRLQERRQAYARYVEEGLTEGLWDKCTAEQLLRRHSKNNEARQVLLYLAATYCRGQYSLMELGERLGPITVSGLGSARQITARRLRESRTLRDRVTEIEARIADPKSKSDD